MENLILTKITAEELTKMITDAVNEAIKNIKIDQQIIPNQDLLTRKEVADKLKISLVTLNDWTKKGMIQSYAIGGRILYKASEINSKLTKIN
jgi:excisionase family DNA binding protein